MGGPGWKLPKGEVETLLWAGTPHVRTKILLQIFAIWSVLLLIPSLILVEVVPDVGGWLALAWAFCSVFIFVPYVSMGTVELTLNVDHTGSFVMRSALAQEFSEYPQAQYGAFHVPEVRFDHVFDVKGASK